MRPLIEKSNLDLDLFSSYRTMTNSKISVKSNSISESNNFMSKYQMLIVAGIQRKRFCLKILMIFFAI